MRGKGFDFSDFRITPAWAGKSFRAVSFRGPDQDHPRVGGEKHGGPCAVERLLWITPAWAGKRPGCGILVLQREDHPRVGGEKFDPYHPHLHMLGSPPRGRGKAGRARLCV